MEKMCKCKQRPAVAQGECERCLELSDVFDLLLNFDKGKDPEAVYQDRLLRYPEVYGDIDEVDEDE